MEDIRTDKIQTVSQIKDRFQQIHDNYSEYRWAWTYKMICDYYNLSEITEKDAEMITKDYIIARRAWINEIKQDAKKEFLLGDVDKDVFNCFISQLDKEIDFENQKLYM
jgi:hypothetical protein